MGSKFKKIVIGFCVVLFTFMLGIRNIDAACSVSASAPGNVVVGNTFKVTTKVSSDVGSWYYVLSYDSSKVQLISGNPKVIGVEGEGRTSTYTFKALKSGTAIFSVANADLASYSTNARCSVSAGSARTIMKTQAEIEASYSRNNNLSSIAIEGAELSPTFSSGVLEYTATLPIDTVLAKVSATPEDGTATITGVGDITVVDGINKIEIVVTAQHGEVKTYTINLTVLELDPIKIKIGKKEYSVVRKSGQIKTIPAGYEESKTKIQNQEITSYISSVTKQTLVGLKDEDGNVDLYIYNSKDNSYEPFIEAKGTSLNIVILDDSSLVPDGFTKKTFTYNKKMVNGYTYGVNDRYYLVYAQDLISGKKDLYLYNKSDNTFQIFDQSLLEYKDYQIQIREYIIIGLAVLLVIMFIIAVKGKKGKKKTFLDEDDGKTIEDIPVTNDKTVEIKKIEEDEFIMPKKSKKQRKKEIEEAKNKLNSNKTSIKRISLDEDE